MVHQYHRATRHPATVALAVLPLALVYGLGLLWASPGARSGVDLVTGLLMSQLGVQGYIGVQSGLSIAVLGYAIYHFRRHTLSRALLTLPIIVESAVYGLAMGFLILHVMEDQHLLGPMLVPSGLLDWTVLSAGAGLHEELLFRLMLLPAMALGLEHGIAMPKPLAWGAAAIGSSLLFAGAHHFAGEPFEVYAFTYRTFAGLFFAGVFLTRGFAVASWTHAIYDLHVLWSNG
jgi:hypothetical protein